MSSPPGQSAAMPNATPNLVASQPVLRPIGTNDPSIDAQPKGNISSDQADQQEVNNIADELRHSLNNKPAGQPTQGEIVLNKDKTPNSAADEDTIYIDREGNIHAQADAAK